MHPSFRAACVAMGLAASVGCSSAHAAGGSGAVTITKDMDGKRPSLGADSKGVLHLVYVGMMATDKTPDIYYCSSSDGCKTWSKPIDVSKTPGVSDDPAIAVERKGALDVVWTDTSSGEANPDIFFSRSADGGKTWTDAANISKTPGRSSEPAIAVAPNGTIHVIWCDTTSGESSPDIWYKSSPDGGKTWSEPSDISKTPGRSLTPAIACGGDGSVHVCWCDTSSGEDSPDVYYTRSGDGGKTWSKAIDVSNTPGISSDPDIAVDDKGNVHVCWADTSESSKSPDIFFATSRDGGKTFEKPRNLSNTPGVSADPAIAADGAGHVTVIWADTSGGEASPDIWCAISGDNGKSFAAAFNLSNTPGVSKLPDVVVVKGEVCGVWEEVEDGKSKIKSACAPLK